MTKGNKIAKMRTRGFLRPTGSRLSEEPRNDERDEASRGCAVFAINMPTVLTILRILLVAPLMACLFADALPARIAAIVCFVVASVTDFIDGRLARKNHQVTTLGIFLDPLADKMLTSLTFLVLVYQHYVPLWIFAVFLIRDFAVDGMRMLAASRSITIAAGRLGKLKTATQMLAITLILLNVIIQNHTLEILNHTLLILAVFLSVISGAQYLYSGFKKLYSR